MTLSEYRKTSYAWPGGYAILALMNDGEILCFNCVQQEEIHEGGDTGEWCFKDTFIHWEGPPLICAHCYKELKSEYGDPEEEEK